MEEQYFIADIKSKCCGADVENMQKTTCKPECHEKMVKEMEQKFGEFKKVTDQPTGIAYRVPSRDIIEKGLNQKDLHKYPKWVDTK